MNAFEVYWNERDERLQTFKSLILSLAKTLMNMTEGFDEAKLIKAFGNNYMNRQLTVKYNPENKECTYSLFSSGEVGRADFFGFEFLAIENWLKKNYPEIRMGNVFVFNLEDGTVTFEFKFETEFNDSDFDSTSGFLKKEFGSKDKNGVIKEFTSDLGKISLLDVEKGLALDEMGVVEKYWDEFFYYTRCDEIQPETCYVEYASIYVDFQFATCPWK